jgi:hypothetical protein
LKKYFFSTIEKKHTINRALHNGIKKPITIASVYYPAPDINTE